MSNRLLLLGYWQQGKHTISTQFVIVNATKEFNQVKQLLIDRYIEQYQSSENQYLRHRAVELRGGTAQWSWLIQKIADAVAVPNGRLHYDLALKVLALEIEKELGVSRAITARAIAYVLHGCKTK